MKEIKFSEMNETQKMQAISQMQYLSPYTDWECDQDVEYDIEKGYTPENDFTFTVNENGEIETCTLF